MVNYFIACLAAKDRGCEPRSWFWLRSVQWSSTWSTPLLHYLILWSALWACVQPSTGLPLCGTVRGFFSCSGLPGKFVYSIISWLHMHDCWWRPLIPLDPHGCLLVSSYLSSLTIMASCTANDASLLTLKHTTWQCIPMIIHSLALQNRRKFTRCHQLRNTHITPLTQLGQQDAHHTIFVTL